MTSAQPDPPNPGPPATPPLPTWLGRTVVILLALQVGLLWTHGSLLQRQHDDLQALREDVQALADNLDQNQDGTDADGADPDASPVRNRLLRRSARHRPRRGAPALVRVQDPAKDPDADEQGAKDLESSRRSGQDAVAKARQVQGQLSIAENIRKADEKAALQHEGNRWLPWLAFGGAAGLLGLVARAWLRRRS